MSDYHVLSRTEGRVIVVFHFVVPNGTNRAGVKYRDIMKLVAKPSTLPTISEDEAAALTAGALLEVNREISIRGMDEVKIQGSIERIYDRSRRELFDKLQRQYDWWGVEGSVG